MGACNLEGAHWNQNRRASLRGLRTQSPAGKNTPKIVRDLAVTQSGRHDAVVLRLENGRIIGRLGLRAIRVV